MSNACTPILVGVTSPVSEILLLSKTAKFPFLTMGVKKLNQVESAHKIMQVGIEIACVPTIKLVYLPQKQ